MPMDRFLIAPQSTGWQNDLRPWMIPDDAWFFLRNMYVFRGRVRKRIGAEFMGSGWNSRFDQQFYSRLRINLGNTDGAGNIAVTVPGAVFAIGQQFTIGTEVFTVYQTGTPAVMLDTGAATVKTYNTTTGALVIHGAAANTAVYFYPSQPVMGITLLKSGTFNNEPTYAFDTQFAYTFTGGAWTRSDTAGVPTWHGSDTNFVWTCNWTGLTDAIVVMFATNFQVTNPNGAGAATDDPIYSYNAATNTWAVFKPYFAPNGGAPQTGPFVQTAKIIIQWQNRLLLLNTIENDNGGGLGTNTWYPMRCRYSWYGSPFSQNAWYQRGQNDNGGTDPNVNLAGGASFIDAATDEQIISAAFIKNRLIVFFDNSTWEIVYTGNEITPFKWQRINSELGSQGTFSSIQHDKYILTFGNVGMHSCNGQNVERIDEKIPDIVFQTKQENSAPTRICGIRDFYAEIDYWAFPSSESFTGQNFPNKLLVYNYRNNTWAFFDDSFTAFGYFEQQNAETWADQTETWEVSNQAWNSGPDLKQFRQVLAGNAEGYIVILNAEISSGTGNLSITNVTTTGGNTQLKVINHMLNPDLDMAYLYNLQGVGGLNGNIYKIQYIDKDTFNLRDPITDDPVTFTGVYTGGGEVLRVNQIQMVSKQWNPYAPQGRDLSVEKIDFCVLRTGDGQVTVGYFASSSNLELVSQGLQSGAQLGTSILETSPYPVQYYPLEQTQERLWHPVYFQSDGEFIQIIIYLSPAQQSNVEITFSDFELEALTLYTQPTRSRME